MTCNSLHTKTPDGEAEGFLFFILSAIEGSACGRYFIRWFAFWASTKIMRYERNGKGFLNIGLRGFIYEEIPGIAPVARR
jgi:H+/Cl- antiporter ClcA